MQYSVLAPSHRSRLLSLPRSFYFLDPFDYDARALKFEVKAHRVPAPLAQMLTSWLGRPTAKRTLTL